MARCNEVVQLAALDGFEVVYLARGRPPAGAAGVRSGAAAAGARALGKAMLAGLDPAELDARLPAELARVTERTLATPEALRRELQEVRRDGLAQDREEVAAGLVCFAAMWA